MTGRELIIYILENGLEDEEIIDKEGNPVGMMTPEEAADKFKVPLATVTAWLGTGKLQSFYIGGTHYIPQTAENPNKWMAQKKNRVAGPVIKLEEQPAEQLTPGTMLLNAVEGMHHEA